MSEQKIICDICGCEITDGNYAVFDGEVLCESCFDENTVICSHCDVRIWSDDNAGTDGTPLCQDCYDEYYTSCEDCGRLIHRDNAYYLDDDDDYAYCESCYHNHSGCIHEYSFKPDPIFHGDGSRFFGVELEIDEAGKDNDNAEFILSKGNRFAEHIYIKSDGSLDEGMEIVTHPKKGFAGRYTCVNITNWNTVEFRMFRGTLKVNTIIATLELVDHICTLANILDDNEITALSWTDFVTDLDEQKDKELITYLKERRLYVNEPVRVGEDDI
ncbi:MAG: hypothetical protein ACI4J1_11555 [Ruminiclostridium sp.]